MMDETPTRQRFPFALALILALVVSVATGPAYAQSEPSASAPSLAELLEEAIFTEETLGDLDAAIDLYRQIRDRAETERTYVAQAHFRLGMCYLKKGQKDEAVVALRLLVEEFPRQQDLVAQARARLSELGYASPGASTVVRRIWQGPDVDVGGAPSRDGRYLPFVDWSTGDLAIRDLSTRRNRRLTDKGSWYDSIAFAEHPRISPDNKRVAYAWFNDEVFYELRLVGLDGSEPEVLYRNHETEYLQPAAWSPDGEHILTLVRRKDQTNQIVLISAAGGTVRVLKDLGWRSPFRISLSPDGRYAAYDLLSSEDSENRDIYLLSLDASREVTLVEHPADDVLPLWAPDGRSIVFCSDRTGAMGIWMVPVLDGESRGSSELLKPDIGANMLMGFTGAGALYYGHMAWANTGNVYVATLDAETVKLADDPTELNQRFVGSNIAPDWSPDGRYLAYVSRRGPPGSTSKVIVVHSVESGDSREIPLTVSQFVTRPRWSSDSSFLLVVGRDEKSRRGLYRIEASDGRVSLVAPFDTSGLIGGLAISPDGTTVFYQRLELETQEQMIVRRDLRTGQVETIELPAMPSHVSNVALSPDGQRWALTVGRTDPPATTLRVMPVGGGEARDLLEIQQPEAIEGGLWVDGLAWTADGRHVLFGRHRPDDSEQTVELWRVSLEGGETEPVGLAMQNLRDVRAHPDGEQIAFTAGRFSAEVWVMENLLPERVTER